jgi:hypothetical protein
MDDNREWKPDVIEFTFPLSYTEYLIVLGEK